MKNHIKLHQIKNMNAIPNPRMYSLYRDLSRFRRKDERKSGIHQTLPFIDNGHWSKHQYGIYDYIENGYKIGWIHDVGRYVTITFDYDRVLAKTEYSTIEEAKQAIQKAWIELAMKI